MLILYHISDDERASVGLFTVYELDDNFAPIIDTIRSCPVYGFRNGMSIDARVVGKHVAPVGSNWSFIREYHGIRYYILTNQHESLAYLACEGIHFGQGSSMMKAKEALEFDKLLPPMVIA